MKLQVALTMGRDPNVNIIQDYGSIRWSELLTQEFQKQYPNVDVEFLTSTPEKVTVQIASGIGPDIVNGGASQFRNLGVQGAFIDMAPLLKRDGIDYMRNQTFWRPQWEAFQYDGKLFALPQYLGTIGIFYNQDMFDNHGIAAPLPNLNENKMDWAQFESLAKKLTRDNNGDSTIDGYAINKNTKNPELAYALLKFFAGPEANAIMAKYVGLQPANRAVVPEYIRLMRVLNRSVYEVNVNVFTDAGAYAYPQFLYNNMEVADSVIDDALRQVLDKNQPARSIWMEAMERLNRSRVPDATLI